MPAPALWPAVCLTDRVDVRRFFRNFLPVRTWEELQDEAFILVYLIPGLSYADVCSMDNVERDEWLERLYQQKKREAKAQKGS